MMFLSAGRSWSRSTTRGSCSVTASGFFALDNTCPHRGGPLAEGDIIANEIVCPWHLWGFDVATGTCGGNPDLFVSTHEVRIEGDRVLVKP